MNSIVIVEDRLERGISLAEQFREYSVEYPDLKLEVSDICYFCADSEKASKDIKTKKDGGFEIRPVSLIDFRKTMDEYINSEDKKFFIIMDYILEDDGSEGTPSRRVNIRYAMNKGRYKTNRLWFYTGTGTENEQLLCQLVGEDHVFGVERVEDDLLRLNLDNAKFREALSVANAAGV